VTFRNIVLASTLFLSAAAPAWSMGDNVVLIATSKVDAPSRLPGLCRVKGTISQVWEGKTFHAGQTLTVRVPCSGGNSYMTPVNAGEGPGAYLVSVSVLRKSKQALARINDQGALIWHASARTYGPWGVADGYRVLDGALLPAVPDHIKS
jgi:hypothetical protein